MKTLTIKILLDGTPQEVAMKLREMADAVIGSLQQGAEPSKMDGLTVTPDRSVIECVSIQRLSHYICDDDIAEAYDILLQAEEDGHGSSDAMDFVTVWEPLEGRTVSQIIEMI